MRAALEGKDQILRLAVADAFLLVHSNVQQQNVKDFQSFLLVYLKVQL